MKQQHREIIAQPWMSQLVINSKRTVSGSRERLTAVLNGDMFKRLVDVCQCWTNTPQGGTYWVNTHNEWVENH